jgi:predicted HAD superfamily phosphohydrolase YqeG
MNNQDIVFVDVDDTIVRTVGSKRIPIPRVIEYIKHAHAQGAILYLWSSGGADYARQSASEFGVQNLFAGFLPKPRIYVDDQNIRDWRNLKHLFPNQVDS